MAATADGAHNLLDNSVVLLGSDCSEGWSHAIDQMPVIVAGGGGGLLRAGAHLRQPGRNLSDVLLTCAQVVAGARISEIGSAEMHSTTPVGEILR